MSNQNHNDNGIIKEKLKKVEELKEIGVEPYGRKYEKLNDIAEINQYDETCDKVFKTAGRIVAFRRMGKNGFGQIQDPTGKIQYYVKKDEVGEEKYEIYKKLLSKISLKEKELFEIFEYNLNYNSIKELKISFIKNRVFFFFY